MQLDVASVASGRLTVVPGTFVSSDALAGFGWPDGSDSLVAEFNFEGDHAGDLLAPRRQRIGPGGHQARQLQASLIVG